MSATSTRRERVETADGGLDAHVAIPQAGSGPGMLLIHEIFGVNDYVRDSARRLAELGYVVLAPDLFWRTQPGLELAHDDEGLQQGFAAMQRLDVPQAVQDAIVALGALRALPEVAQAGGHAGVLGFCLGGTIAFQVAAHGDPDTAVCYYGSGIPAALGDAASIDCPTIIHWGSEDPYTPADQFEAIAAMAADREGVEFHLHEGAGHAFDNSFSARFHEPRAAAAAWTLTTAFLERTLPAR